MGILDIVFLAILFIAFISGMQKGLITSALACVAMLGAFLIAKGLESQLAAEFMNDTSFEKWLEENFTTDVGTWFHVLSFVIVFVIAYAALMLVVNLINNVFRIPKLKAVDGLLGGVLGLVRGYVVICVIVAAAKILFKPLESEGNDFMLKLIDDAALGRFFDRNSMGDLFQVGKMIAQLK